MTIRVALWRDDVLAGDRILTNIIEAKSVQQVQDIQDKYDSDQPVLGVVANTWGVYTLIEEEQVGAFIGQTVPIP